MFRLYAIKRIYCWGMLVANSAACLTASNRATISFSIVGLAIFVVRIGYFSLPRASYVLKNSDF